MTDFRLYHATDVIKIKILLNMLVGPPRNVLIQMLVQGKVTRLKNFSVMLHADSQFRRRGEIPPQFIINKLFYRK